MISNMQELVANPELEVILVVFLTVKMELTEPRRFLLGAKGAIAKPFNPLKLDNQVTTVLGWDSQPE